MSLPIAQLDLIDKFEQIKNLPWEDVYVQLRTGSKIITRIAEHEDRYLCHIPMEVTVNPQQASPDGYAPISIFRHNFFSDDVFLYLEREDIQSMSSLSTRFESLYHEACTDWLQAMSQGKQTAEKAGDGANSTFKMGEVRDNQTIH